MGLHHNKVLVLHLEVGGVYYILDVGISAAMVVCLCHMWKVGMSNRPLVANV